MKNILVLCSLILIGFGAPKSAEAQEMQFSSPSNVEKHMRETRYAYKTFEYQKRLIRAKEYQNGVRKGIFPIYSLVESYMGTNYYDPLAEDTINKLYEFAYLADTNKDNPEAQTKAVEDFIALSKMHMGNFAVIEKVIPLVRANPALGDLKFLKWLEQQLTRRIIQSGDGKTMASAFQIVSMAEESYILARKNVKVLKTEVLNNATQYYHIHLTENLINGDIEKVYIMLSNVMTRFTQIQKEQDPYYSYPLSMPENLLSNR